MKTPKIIGWIGPAGDSYVSGWILDKNQEAKKLNVVVEVNGVKMPPVVASSPRPHLKERGIKQVRHGFKLYIPDEVLTQSPGPIRMWSAAHPSTIIEAREQFPPLKKPSEARLLTVIDKALDERKKARGIDWSKMAALGGELVEDKDFLGILLSAGRGCIYNRQYAKGLRILSACVYLFPKNKEALYYKGVLLSNSGELLDALEVFKELLPSGWKPKQVLLEYSKALVRAIDKSGHKADESLKALFVQITKELFDLDDGKISYSPSMPLRLAHCGEAELALAIADRLIKRRPEQPHGMVNKSRILIEEGRYDEGLELSREILRVWPGNEVAQYHLRVYSGFSDSDEGHKDPVFALLETVETGGTVREFANAEPTDTIEPLSETLDITRQIDWLCVPTGEKTPDASDWAEVAKKHDGAGCADLPDGSGRLWRVEVLRALIESSLLDLNDDLLKQLDRWYDTYVSRAAAKPRHGGKVLLISRYGTSKFGGAEHTMASLSAYYRETGRSTVLAGTDDSAEQDVELGPNQFGDRIPADATDLRTYILERGFDAVHAISGMGFQVAQALAYSNISMVYGIYFWRDVLGREGLETYFDDNDAPIPRAEFKYIMRQAHTVFVNSKYTRSIIEQAHNIRLPIVYSIPEELST